MTPDEPDQTYQYLESFSAIQCLKCNEITHVADYVRKRYCPKCRRYHADMMAEKRALREAEVRRHAD